MREQALNESVQAADAASELARRIAVLPPSLANAEMNVVVDEVDAARAREYALLSALLGRAPDLDLLSRLANLQVDPTPLGVAHAGLAQAARIADVEQVGREFFNLFIGLGRGELLPYGSYYLTGFLHERPLARLRGDLADLGVARADDQCEPEDHIAILCEVMAGLAGRKFANPADGSPRAEREVLDKHLAPWARR